MGTSEGQYCTSGVVSRGTASCSTRTTLFCTVSVAVTTVECERGTFKSRDMPTIRHTVWHYTFFRLSLETTTKKKQKKKETHAAVFATRQAEKKKLRERRTHVCCCSEQSSSSSTAGCRLKRWTRTNSTTCTTRKKEAGTYSLTHSLTHSLTQSPCPSARTPPWWCRGPPAYPPTLSSSPRPLPPGWLFRFVVVFVAPFSDKTEHR